MPDQVTITSATDDGGRVEITIKKTGEDKGEIEVKKWNPGTNPPAPPDETDTNKLKNIRSSPDGSRVTSRVDRFIPSDVTFTIRCPEEDPEPAGGEAAEETEKPTVTVKVDAPGTDNDSEESYEITEEEQAALKDFVKPPRYPRLASAGYFGTGALGMLTGEPRVASPQSLRRVSVALLDIADSLRHNASVWDETEESLRYIGFDPGVAATLRIAEDEESPTLCLSVKLPGAQLSRPYLSMLKKYAGHETQEAHRMGTRSGSKKKPRSRARGAS